VARAGLIRKGYADIAAGQVHYRIRAGDGETVLFLHQTASSGAMWERVMAAWPGAETLYAVDTPGFGGSFDPVSPPSMSDYAGWIVDAAAALGLRRFHLIGHHTGSGIALQVAADRPEMVASIAMIGISCLSADERGAFAAKLGAPFRPVRSGAYLLKNWEYLRVGGADADIALLHREMVDQLRAWATRPHAYAAAWAQDNASLLARLTVPAIAIAAPDDLLFPSLDRVAAIRPDIPCVTLSRGANYEPDLAADELTPLLSAHVARFRAGPRPA
jgi:pimeloyl-ACP methyl ester carboxylesterase